MGLTREQFDTISNNYNNRRLENKIEMDRRIDEVYENVPQIAEYDREIASLAVNATRLALSGDASAKDSLRGYSGYKLEKKRAALLMNRYPGTIWMKFYLPYLQGHQFVHGRPCECLKSEIINLIYSRSELNEILAVENFDNFQF